MRELMYIQKQVWCAHIGVDFPYGQVEDVPVCRRIAGPTASESGPTDPSLSRLSSEARKILV